MDAGREMDTSSHSAEEGCRGCEGSNRVRTITLFVFSIFKIINDEDLVPACIRPQRVELKRRMRAVHDDLALGAELVYVNAPGLCPMTPAEGKEDTRRYEKFLKGAPDAARAWWWLHPNGQEDYAGFSESLNYLKTIWMQQGPFDGILGFAQGAAMALYLALDICYPNVQEGVPSIQLQPPRFLIFIASYLSVAPVHEGYLDRVDGRIPIPSLHVFGEADSVIKSRSSKEVAERFRRGYALVLEHNGGHIIPQQTRYRSLIQGFVSLFAAPQGIPLESLPVPVPLPLVYGLTDPHEDEDAVQIEGGVDEDEDVQVGDVDLEDDGDGGNDGGDDMEDDTMMES
ncbi:serine hydrolase-domain-containing protein [Chytridium lagenaria]|nr:serine hydrolase-domain-containing protein [Chytridium lagenaria]